MESSFKPKAIALRRLGLSYSEILQRVPVAKSTLALWLQSVGISKKQRQRLTEKKLAAMQRGWETIRVRRQERSKQIFQKAIEETPRLILDPLWLTGVILYWAEGTKEKTWRIGERVALTNMDPAMITLFVRWAKRFFELSDDLFEYSLYVHRHAHIANISAFWIKKLGIQTGRLRVYLKPDQGKQFRKNTADSYFGIIRVRIFKSTDLQRRIAGWIQGVVRSFV